MQNSVPLRYLLFMLLGFGCLRASSQETASEKLWRSYADEMAAFISGGNGKVDGLQLVSVATVADWDNDSHDAFNRDVKWCDTIPKFGPMYEDSSRRVSEAYRLYLEALKLPVVDKKKEAKVKPAREAWLASLSKENDLFKQVGPAWVEFQKSEAGIPEKRRKSYDTWYAADFGKKIGDARTAATGKAQKYSEILAETYSGYGEVTDAIREFSNTGYQVESQAPDGLTLPNRACSITPLLKDFVDRGKAQVAANAYAHTLSISTSHNERHASEWSASAGASFFGFISVGGGYSHSEVHEKKRNFQLDVKFRNLEVVNFKRDKWFNGTVIGLLNANDVFIPGAPTNADKLWGSSGIFRLLPVAAVVAYQPTITVVLDDSDYDDVHNQWQAGASIGFGPFQIAGQGHGSNQDTTWDSNSHSVTSTIRTETPYVIAVKSVVMPGV